jgi:hypothetical protein
LFFFFGILISKQIPLASLISFPLRIKTSFRKNITDDSVFFYGSGMYRKHPNHTYGRNWNNSSNNQAHVILSRFYPNFESGLNLEKRTRTGLTLYNIDEL